MDQLLPLPKLPPSDRRAGRGVCRLRGQQGALSPGHASLLQLLIVRRGGDWHQDAKDGVPVFDDGAVGRFTWRAWGHLLAAIWSAEDRCTYTYMDFYMDSCVTDAGMELSPP